MLNDSVALERDVERLLGTGGGLCARRRDSLTEQCMISAMRPLYPG